MSDCCDAAFRNVYYSSRKCAWADAVPGVKKEKQFDPDDPFFRVGASHTSMVARTKHNKTRYQMYQEAQRPKKQTTARPVYRIRCEQVPDNSTKRMRARAARKQEKDQRNVFLPDGGEPLTRPDHRHHAATNGRQAHRSQTMTAPWHGCILLRLASLALTAFASHCMQKSSPGSASSIHSRAARS